ncbi:MAG: 2-oxoacid:acceptor oxidoreductase family protein [Proteobacteria bacterium]|nr:2-oxoacid:acceptor oxidoreductase family protein [Pseudomonadota bacterium]MBU1585390.1 2-oxoacid:acceptor oxidoreductase family protein [Pseudomonadota bacterium]MBU2453366.1 2-oxoacid:acceptor oxidoreductase family protein [Pseudomonadota bacterium]MBU2630662.1 2-oxoacid:acceptor oxidoreductase family protein [Pseudomonadota bacterium]
MNSFLNKSRPPVYCPGCTHEKITTGLDKAFDTLNLKADRTVIVTDIGCSGLFDTFFNVHALHGIHGRALTYASGLKLADPELNVIVTMGDGGLGIGGAHVLAACRRNLDLTLIVLNNFNFGMTGGQYSATTPTDAVVGSEFLNQAEMPLDICAIAQSAGATYIDRCSGLDADLPGKIARAIEHKGFSIIETLGMCTGRYTKRNLLTPKVIDQMVADLPEHNGIVKKNQRPEYGERYRALAKERNTFPEAVNIKKEIDVKEYQHQEVVILGSAGMRIVTAGDIVCYAGICAGMNVSMKNDYNITVLRGQSVSEILISQEKIGYPGIESPSVVLALSDEGVQRRKKIFATLKPDTFVLKEKSVAIPQTPAEVVEIDFKELKIKKQDWALASLAVMAKNQKAMNTQMLTYALKSRFNEKTYLLAMETIEKIFQA